MSPSRSEEPSAREKIFKDDGHFASRLCQSGSVSALSSAMSMPLAASSIAGCKIAAQRKLARAVFLQRQRQPRDGAGDADA